jgi:hypothetical protein
MEKKTAWSDLPNAKHINWILASLREYTMNWNRVNVAKCGPAWDIAYRIAYNAGRSGALFATMNVANRLENPDGLPNPYFEYIEANDVVWSTARRLAWSSLVALTAYDDFGYMIESDVEEIKMLATLGDTKAILLLPACVVFNEIKLLTNASTVL